MDHTAFRHNTHSKVVQNLMKEPASFTEVLMSSNLVI